MERPNAGAHLPPEAGATLARTLEAVGSSAWFGAVWAWNTDCGLDSRLLSTCTVPWYVT